MAYNDDKHSDPRDYIDDIAHKRNMQRLELERSGLLNQQLGMANNPNMMIGPASSLTLNPNTSATYHTMARPGPYPRADEVPSQEPQTIYPVEGGFVVFPMSLIDASSYEGNTRSFTMTSIMDQMKFFTTMEAATAYLTVEWSGMLKDKDREYAAEAEAEISGAAIGGMITAP